jgi:murein DD-endopeptidase MepM/ murein hydrolase activator NlpD
MKLFAILTIAAGLLFLVPAGASASSCTGTASSANCNPPPTAPPPTSGGKPPGSNPPPSQAPPTTPPPTPDPVAQRLIDKARLDLGNGIADALATVQRLSDAMAANADQQGQVQQQVDSMQSQLDSLDQQIQQLDDQVTTTQEQIVTERTEIGILARELYQQPDSLLLRLLKAGSLRDMVTQTSDMTVAAMHVDALRTKLTSDLAKAQQDQVSAQSDRDQAAQLQAQLSSALSQLQDLAQQEQDSSDQLQSAVSDTQGTLDTIDTIDTATVAEVAAMLLQRQQQIIATAEHEVWQQEQLWSTLNTSAIPAIPAPTATTVARPPSSGAPLAWPIQGAVLTQGFGPSTLWLEPAMFGFAHFHTGLDLASTNTRISAAADGVVAVVGAGSTGYGNYVIIVHGGGLVSLYGHMVMTMVKVGQSVTQGQQIGIEGTTGASTGVHLHFEVRLNGTPVDPSPFLPPMGTA